MTVDLAEAELWLAEVEAGRNPTGFEHRARRLRGLQSRHDPLTQAILDELDKPLDMPFANETPLEDVLKHINDSVRSAKLPNGIPFYVDPPSLEVVQKTKSSPVVLNLDGVPLKTTLRLMLKQLDLAFAVKDGFVIIGSPHCGSFLEELGASAGQSGSGSVPVPGYGAAPPQQNPAKNE
jgi:hypothetical protein